MHYNINISFNAESNFREIECYIAKTLEAPYSAMRIITLLHKAIASLAVFPKAGEEAPEEELAKAGVRIIHVQKYRIYYGVDDEKKTVNIYAVLHHLQDEKNRVR